MRVLHYTKYYPPYFGGIEKVTFDMVEGGIDEINVEVLCFKKNKMESKFDCNKKYKIKRNKAILTLFKMPVSLMNFFSLVKRINRNDIVHVHLPNPIAMLYVIFANMFCGKKIVAHWHSDIVNQKKLGFLIKPLEVLFLKKSDIIIVTTDAYAASSKSLINFKNKIRVVPIGIDNSDLEVDYNFYSDLRKRYNGYKIIFSLGRLTYYKGFEYLVEAARKLPDNYKILIGGTGEEQAKLERIIRDNALEGKVILLGRIPQCQMGSYYKICDVFCLPSIERSEAFGVVQIEAMSFSKPVISTNISGSGVAWVNKHETSGLIVEPKSSEELAQAIDSVCKSNNLAEQLGLGAKKRFDSYFTRSEMNIKVFDIYKEITCDN